mmetsp:Transcript_36590/g.92410  ORF Transcript_36590/g.92410 Transcript_36590/m.92410 type:complete len:211 (-) Transcript_36590:2096-2728(-)
MHRPRSATGGTTRARRRAGGSQAPSRHAGKGLVPAHPRTQHPPQRLALLPRCPQRSSGWRGRRRRRWRARSPMRVRVRQQSRARPGLCQLFLPRALCLVPALHQARVQLCAVLPLRPSLPRPRQLQLLLLAMQRRGPEGHLPCSRSQLQVHLQQAPVSERARPPHPRPLASLPATALGHPGHHTTRTLQGRTGLHQAPALRQPRQGVHQC